MSEELNINDAIIPINYGELKKFNFKEFDIQEIVFLCFLMVYCQKTGEFFHTAEQVKEEMGISKDKLSSIIKSFEDLGILKSRVNSFPRRKYFELDYKKLSTKEILQLLYLPDVDTKNTEKVFKELAKQQKERKAELEKQQKSKPARINVDIEPYVYNLKDTFLERRKVFNNDPQNKWRLATVNLAFANRHKANLRIALNEYDFDDLNNAFRVYCDDYNSVQANKQASILKEKPASPMGYFLMKKDNEFPQIIKFLDAYAAGYGRKKE